PPLPWGRQVAVAALPGQDGDLRALPGSAGERRPAAAAPDRLAARHRTGINIGRVSPDVIVVGAGAIGTSIAYQLAKAGVKVMVFERGQVGGGATGASAGMIQINPDRNTPSSLVTLEAESARLFPALATELLDRTGMDIGY